MNDKTYRIVYYLGTGILTAIMCFSAFNYFFNYEMVAGFFENYGYPTYIIYPLAIAKIFGLIAIWSNLSRTFKEWAYAGFFFNLCLAYAAHSAANDSGLFAMIAMLGLVLSYWGWKRM